MYHEDDNNSKFFIVVNSHIYNDEAKFMKQIVSFHKNFYKWASSMQCTLYSHFPFCQRLTTLTFLLVNYSYADHNSKKIPIQMLHNSISTLYLHINPLSSFLCRFLSAKFVICPMFWTLHYVYANSTIQFHNLGFASSIPRLLYSKCTYIKPVTLHFTFIQSYISISFS